MTELSLTSRVCFGKDAVAALSEFKGNNVVIVTDPFFAKTKKTDVLIERMPGSDVAVYSDIAPDPTIDQVRETFKFVKKHNADVIVAFGGGSAIDTAKAVILVAREDPDFTQKLKLVAIPTTSGTGSEVTSFTVISDPETCRKYPLVDDDILPSLAVLDYTFTMTVPPSVTAATGMDVLTHAIEAYVSVNANHISDAFAEKAVSLIYEYLYKAYKDGNNEAAREGMQAASYLAGISFNTAGLGITHSIAHALGANFHIPHGLANAMVLSHVIEYNACMDIAFGADKCVAAKRYAKIAELLGLGRVGTRLACQKLAQEMRVALDLMKIPKTLVQAGVKPEQYKACRQAMIDSALADVCTATNPRQPTAEDIGKILDKLYGGKMLAW